MLTTRHLNTKESKKRLSGKKSPKKIKNKNEKENGRLGDSDRGGNIIFDVSRKKLTTFFKIVIKFVFMFIPVGR